MSADAAESIHNGQIKVQCPSTSHSTCRDKPGISNACHRAGRGSCLHQPFIPVLAVNQENTALNTADNSTFLYLLIIFWQSMLIISHMAVNLLPNRTITAEAERKAWQRHAVANWRQQVCWFTSPLLFLLLNTSIKCSHPPGHRWATTWAAVLTHRLEGLCTAQGRIPPKATSTNTKSLNLASSVHSYSRQMLSCT